MNIPKDIKIFNNQQDTIFYKVKSPVDSTINKDTIKINSKVDSNVIFHKPKLFKALHNNIQTDTAKLPSTITTRDYTFTNNDLINSYISSNIFKKEDIPTYNILRQSEKTHITKPIFTPLKSESSGSTLKQIYPKERFSQSTDWYIIPVLAGLIAFVFVYNAYSKYFGQLYESVFFRFVSKKLVNDKNVAFRRFGFILDFLFILSFSLLIDQILFRFNLYVPAKGTEYYLAIFVATFIVAMKIIRFIVFRISALFTNQNIFIRDLYVNSLLYTRILGLVLVPLVFLMIYFTSQLSLIVILLSLFIVFIALLFRMIRSIKVFIDNGFSIFYFILYLCALEIAPLLVIWKEVQAR